MAFPPRPVSSQMRLVPLTGKLMAGKDGGPVLLMMPLSEHFYLPLFSTLEQLDEALRGVAEYDSVKVVDDGEEFLRTVPRKVGDRQLKVIVDPLRQPDGSVRFTELKNN